MAVPVLVCDFDGTLALRDLGDALCDRFADVGWRDTCDAWHRGEMTLPEAQTIMWGTVRASQAELLAAATELGAFRSGAELLFEAAADGALELVIASGGFDLYVEHLLGERRAHVSAVYCNTLEPRPEGARVDFPHTDLARPPYAIDKAAVLDRHRHPGRRIAFAGDGWSDRSVATTENVEIFAVRGSPLEQWCNDAGSSYIPFEDFSPIVAKLTQ